MNKSTKKVSGKGIISKVKNAVSNIAMRGRINRISNISGGMSTNSGYSAGGVNYNKSGIATGSSKVTKPVPKNNSYLGQKLPGKLSDVTSTLKPKSNQTQTGSTNSSRIGGNSITYNKDNTFSRNNEKVGSYESVPVNRVAGGATTTSSAGGNTYGASAKTQPSFGRLPKNTTPVTDYSSKGNETMKALEEEAKNLNTDNREEMDRKVARQFRDQLDFIKQAKAIAVQEAKRANMEKSNTQRAIQAAAGNLGTEFGAGVQQKVNESNTNDITKAQLPYVEQEVALNDRMQQEKQDRLKNFVITSAFREGITDPMELADYAAQNGIELTIDELQKFAKSGGTIGDTGTLSLADAMKAGVPYGTTYEQLYGQTLKGGNGNAKQYNFTANMYAKRMSQAEDAMSEVEGDIAALSGVDLMAKRMTAKSKAGNLLIRDPKLQKQFQAERNFINAVLRKESGAAIGRDEYESAAIQYFPMPGDTPEVLQQKKENRRAAIDAMIQEAGSVYGGQSQTFDTATSSQGSTEFDW